MNEYLPQFIIRTVASIIAGVVVNYITKKYINQNRKNTMKTTQKRTIGWIVGGLTFAIAFFLIGILTRPTAVVISTPPVTTTKPSIGITVPQNGAKVQTLKMAPDGQYVIPVSGTSDGVEQGFHIYILVRETGGDQWWISGPPCRPTIDGSWSQPRASFGDSNASPTQDYEIYAIITTNAYKSGVNFANSAVPPPDSLAVSKMITFTRLAPKAP